MKIFLLIIIMLTPILTINSQNADTLNTGITVQDTTAADTTVSITTVNDTTAADTIRSAADSLRLAKARPLIPLFPEPLLTVRQEAQVISRREIIYNYYSYTGDLLRQFPFSIQRHLGITGQPHEVLIYGNGFNNISYMMDGILLNNRFTNSLDLNYVQSEAIDSIEIIPSPRAFLYGIYNNPASVNFIPRENYTLDSRQGPFSRLRYYQAPNEEAMIDATYRTYLARKLVGIFEMTNYSAADRFPNSGHGSWKFRTGLNYLISENINIKAGYNYNRTETRLFGGVNIDSLNARDTLDITELSELGTPVLHPTRYQKYHMHQFNLTLRNMDSGPFSGKVDLYYINSLTERRENEKADPDSLFVLINNDKYNLSGILINQGLKTDLFDLQISGSAERVDFKMPTFESRRSINTVSASGRIILNLLNNTLFPSAFSKYLNYHSKSFFGAGSDLIYRPNERFSFYGGVSRFNKPYDPEVLDKTTISSYEIGAEMHLGKFNFGLKAFNQHFKDDIVIWSSFDAIGLRKINRSVTGIGIDLNVHLWKINLESHSAYYNTDISVSEVRTLPDVTSISRIYYQDTLFNSNLFLRTGFEASYIGSQDYFNYDSFNQRIIYFTQPLHFDADNIKSLYMVDFFLIGEIRRRAIIYFTFENLLDKQQYMVPGYPLPRRGLRLGVSWEFLN